MSETLSVATSVKRFGPDSTNKPLRDLEFAVDLLADQIGDIYRPVAGGETVVIDLSEVIPDSPDQRMGVVLVQTSGKANVSLFGAGVVPVNGQILVVDRLGAELATVDKTISVENVSVTEAITVTVFIGNLASPA